VTAPATEVAKRAQMYLWVAVFNLMLAMLGVALMVFIFLADRDVRREVALQQLADMKCVEMRAPVAPPPPVSDTKEVAPPQDTPRDGYFGDKGTDIRPALKLTLETVRSGQEAYSKLLSLPFYSPEVLPARTIHVVNLWATWCEPCRDEMPDFKAMFARRNEWAKDVRFLPILLQDSTDPAKAYSEIARIMPSASIMLADRAMGNPLATALASDANRVLFRNALPVTLVLDCNRRVRWGHFAQLNEVDIKDLERVVDQLRAELDDHSPGAWCSEEWPGNGRCEGKESTAAGHVIEDCGELKRRTPDSEPVAELVPSISPDTCPEGSELQPDGRCKRKLRGTFSAVKTVKPTQFATCGNGKCDGRDTVQNCCEDCCEAPLVCRQMGDEPVRCMVKSLRGG